MLAPCETRTIDRRLVYEMTFAPSIDQVSAVRRFAEAVSERVLDDPELASRVALAIHELLENAVKYSVDGRASLRVELDAIARPATVAIRTRNRADAARAAELAGDVDELARTTDRFAMFLIRLERVARSSEAGGLGLVRVVAEADMELSCEIAGDVVEVIAIGRAPAEAA